MSVLEELKARVIAGGKATPKEYAEARATDELAELKAQSEAREAKEKADAEHQAAVAEFLTDYEEFMTTDLDPLRDAYARVVLEVADLHTQLEEHRKKQSGIKVRASRLGLHNHPRTGNSIPQHAPVPEDAERWRTQLVTGDYLEHAVEEGKCGFVQSRGKAVSHVLHTPERREEIRSLNEPGVNKKQVGAEMRDRILTEAEALPSE
ncbi:hypothetical protein [Nocardia altamirensis]|uniref:hypothetical protein n=1 Tax=Nocardia altamirensis TaxID=472158 RepID=UPI0008401279|nr:hypothetical protein [Nocardia altamirensis]